MVALAGRSATRPIGQTGEVRLSHLERLTERTRQMLESAVGYGLPNTELAVAVDLLADVVQNMGEQTPWKLRDAYHLLQHQLGLVGVAAQNGGPANGEPSVGSV